MALKELSGTMLEGSDLHNQILMGLQKTCSTLNSTHKSKVKKFQELSKKSWTSLSDLRLKNTLQSTPRNSRHKRL